MEVIKKYKSQLIFQLALNIVVGIFITFSSYYHLPLYYTKDYLMYGVHFIILQFTVFGFLYFLSLNRIIFNLIFPVFFIVFSSISFWIYTQDVSISESLLQAIFETKLDIAIDILTYQFVLYLVFLIFITYLILKWRKKLEGNSIKSPLTILALISLVTFFYLNLNGIGNLKWRMPYNLSFGIIEYFKKPEIKIIPVDKYLKGNRTDINIVFVLGESVRSKNLGINNYNRNTTPLLSKLKNLISYPYVYTSLTYTATSVPQIVTNKSINNFNNKFNKFYSIYSVLNKLKYSTSWIGNQSPEKSYSPYINENESVNLIDLQHGVFSFNKKLDKELLPFFEEVYKQKGKKFVTLHMIGSHWWYENRYSSNFRKFKPTLNSKYIPSQSKEQIINSYDNTILYLDYFLNEVTKICNKNNEKTIMIYLSDHGENLGENGKWLHAQNSDASTNPAMLVWYSDEFKKSYPVLVENLKLNSKKKITTDFFFHSILNLLDVKDFNYNKSVSIFNRTVPLRDSWAKQNK